MAFRHLSSCESFKSELDLFTLPPTQNSIESGHWVQFKPVSSLSEGAPIEFVIANNNNDYIDLVNTFLHVNVSVTRADGTKLKTTDGTSTVNNLLYSMFSQVDVSLNGHSMSHSNHLYPYRAYLENLLNFNQTAKESRLTSALWYKDGNKSFAEEVADSNSGYSKRKKFAQMSNFDLMNKLNSDLFNVEKYLMNGVELRVKLSRSKNEFCLMDSSSTSTSKLVINDISLFIRKVAVNPSILVAHAGALEAATAKYPITKTELKTITISKGAQSKSLDNVFLGAIPDRIILGFVSNTNMNGTMTTNPFEFNHFNLDFLSLYIDGKQIPSKPLQPDYANGNYVQSYFTLFSGTGIAHADDGNCISRDDYPKGYCLYAFDLTADLSASCPHWCVKKHGSVRFDFSFSKALTDTVNCVIYAEYKSIFEVDKYRNIISEN